MLSSEPFPLITSLAPKLNRLQLSGKEIGFSYQKYCIESWMNNGFKVYSLNTADEIEILKHIYLDVHFVEAPRDGTAVVGRPLVHIADMVTALKDRGYKQCGIVNSDVYMNDAPSFLPFLRKEISNSCVFGHRIDVKELGEIRGGAYTLGYDFFFFEIDQFDTKAFSPFLQGVPWWDYALPLMLGMRGTFLKKLDSPIFFHLIHGQKWQTDSWRAYWKIMRQMLDDLIFSSLDPTTLAAVPGFQGLHFLLGEGAFISHFITSGGDDVREDVASDKYIVAYAYYCCETITNLSQAIYLPSTSNAAHTSKVSAGNDDGCELILARKSV